MPELPEVETVRRSLKPRLVGRRVVRAEALLPRMLQNLDPASFREKAAGQVFAGLDRRGKFLLGRLASGATLVIHLRMTGRLAVEPAAAERPAYTRFALTLDDGNELRFIDVRTFGTLHWFDEGRAPAVPGLVRMGPEPLGKGFTAAALASRLADRRAPVKSLLLDQRVVAGVGNIYADEALFRAGIHPARPGGELSERDVARLHRAIRQVLREGLECGGTTIRSYADGRGRPGRFQERLAVYGRGGQPCLRCRAPVERIRLGGRSSWLCRRCQA